MTYDVAPGRPAASGILLDVLAAARREADHYRTSVEMARHISWSADASGAIRTVSTRWTEVTGIDVSKALDNGWLEAVHPDDVERTLRAWRLALETASSVDVDYRLRTPSGDCWFRSCASPQLDEDGAVLAWFGTLENIDDRKRAEHALSASEERFRLAAEAAGVGIWDYDALLGRRLWSDVFRAMLGLDPDVPAEPATALALVVPEDRPMLQQLVDSINAGDTHPRFELTVRIRRDDDGALRWMQTSGWKVEAANGRIERVLVTVRDVTEQLTAEQRVRWAAEHDPLTGLVNRAAFNRLLEEAIARAGRSGGSVLTLALFDVDHLKETNDTIGHDAGDALLCTVATRLAQALGDDVVVARLGGDEFAAIIETWPEAMAEARLRHALRALREPVVADTITLDCQATVGLSAYPHDGRSALDLLKTADLALYAGKATARGEVSRFRPEMRARMQRRTSMLSVARMVARDNRVMPFYQPKVRLSDGALSGFEALLRWRHDTLGVQGPDTIAAAFDDLTTAVPLGERMLERICADLTRWRDDGLALTRVALNLSPAEFRRDDLFDRIMGQLHRHALPAELLELEVTETVFLGRGAETVGETLAAFHHAGVTVALDDFGTGYASLKHLREYPVDVIKIDRSFVADLLTDPGDAAIVDAILGLAKQLGIAVVAEGVETAEQAAYLLTRRCSHAQGYLFGRPMPAEDARALLAADAARRVEHG
ncbi:putative bifunctional diguanylate cyclase/phosphodiesterase [Sphingomonas abaci]|uniref:Diguanylate cyclase (GGDEF)-like protein/PAS domain S-box-containing protein n=1 Tax=Sphingomonas abaci TaxID=237611 RepID=A0A7W7EWD7_9SPHN|nr:GGDEF domain-containing phosphodiesterase [Sphingomonas abaci]MBB4615976.1 diguanylate cyclase (GGDEF)-like protein/PAS domain S-box-containing protein [Sphingomonas abaci]